MIHWKELAANSSFRNLFSETGENPLRARIDHLEFRLRDLTVTDPVETMRYKAELAGIRCVEETVLRVAEKIPSSGPMAGQLAHIGNQPLAPTMANQILPPTAPQEPSTSRSPRPEKTLLQRMFGGRIGT